MISKPKTGDKIIDWVSKDIEKLSYLPGGRYGF